MPVEARAKHSEAGTRTVTGARRPLRRRAFLLLGLGLSFLGGCAFWDEVTSREFTVKGLFVKPDPLQVLQTSTDGDHRQKALRRLSEPKEHGGSDADQELYVRILCMAANTEKHAICRLAAIQTMAKFKDPRIVDGMGKDVPGLKQAYYTASSFNPDTAHMLKCAVLKSLGETGHPSGVEVLVNALRQPPVEGASVEVQRVMNERITAARALGHFKQYQATEALLQVLVKDKDPAVRNRAHDSLCQATGKDFPPDAEIWAEFLHNPQPTPSDNPLHKLVNWFAPSGEGTQQ
jgi:hypothetical protein